MNGARKTMQTYADGRDEQFRDMMQALAVLEARYKGVRGELLAKVRAELARFKPGGATLSVVSSPVLVPEPQTETSCRVCGRGMKRTGTDERLVCQNGHVR